MSDATVVKSGIRPLLRMLGWFTLFLLGCWASAEWLHDAFAETDWQSGLWFVFYIALVIVAFMWTMDRLDDAKNAEKEFQNRKGVP